MTHSKLGHHGAKVNGATLLHIFVFEDVRRQRWQPPVSDEVCAQYTHTPERHISRVGALSFVNLHTSQDCVYLTRPLAREKGYCSQSDPHQYESHARCHSRTTQTSPTDFTDHTLDGDQVKVDNLTKPTAHSNLMSPFGSLAEKASSTGYEPNAQLDGETSNNFASVQGDSGMSSTGSSSSTRSVTECVATTIQVADTMNQAPRNRLRQQDHKRRFSQQKDGTQEIGKSFKIFDDTVSTKFMKPFSSNTYTRNERLSNCGKQNGNSVLKPQ